MSDIKLKVQKRNITGRKVKQLRQKNVLPANIYGKDIKSLPIKIDTKAFQVIFEKVGETNIVNIQIDNSKTTRPVLIHNVQFHPVTDEFLHVDLHQVDVTKKVNVAVPIELKGEAPASSAGGVIVQLLQEIEVEALPTNLPNKFTIDISKLKEINQGIAVKDIKTEKDVKLLVEDPETLIVKVEKPTEEKEPEETPEETPEEASEETPEAGTEDKVEEKQEGKEKGKEPVKEEKDANKPEQKQAKK